MSRSKYIFIFSLSTEQTTDRPTNRLILGQVWLDQWKIWPLSDFCNIVHWYHKWQKSLCWLCLVGQELMTWVDDAPESDIKQSHISVSMCQLLPWLWGCWREDDDHHWSCLCFWENCLTFRKSKVSCKCKHNVTGDTFDSSRASPLTSTRYKTLAELLPTSKSNLLEMSIGVLPWDTGDHLNPWEKGKSSTLLICISTFVNIR